LFFSCVRRNLIEDFDGETTLENPDTDQVFIPPRPDNLDEIDAHLAVILEACINPLVAIPDGVAAIDLRLTVDPETL